MGDAILFSGKYGSTKQYANWISEDTELPVLDIKIPFLKKKLVRWIAGKEIKKMTANTN